MTWDITVHRFSRKYASIAEIPDDEQCLTLGTNDEVRAVIDRYFAAVDWSDPAWGIFGADHDSIEFNLGTDEPHCDFMMHVRASPEIIPIILAMCRSQEWQALDCSKGTFLGTSLDAPKMD